MYSDGSSVPASDAEKMPAPRRVRHKKRGTIYTVIGTAELQMATDPVDGSEMMVCRGEDGRLWVRQVHEFEDGRFEDVTGDAP